MYSHWFDWFIFCIVKPPTRLLCDIVFPLVQWNICFHDFFNTLHPFLLHSSAHSNMQKLGRPSSNFQWMWTAKWPGFQTVKVVKDDILQKPTGDITEASSMCHTVCDYSSLFKRTSGRIDVKFACADLHIIAEWTTGLEGCAVVAAGVCQLLLLPCKRLLVVACTALVRSVHRFLMFRLAAVAQPSAYTSWEACCGFRGVQDRYIWRAVLSSFWMHLKKIFCKLSTGLVSRMHQACLHVPL